jgi:hypothetical protein
MLHGVIMGLVVLSMVLAMLVMVLAGSLVFVMARRR